MPSAAQVFILALVASAAVASPDANSLPTMVGQFPLESPGFLHYTPQDDTMLVTTFGALGSGGLYLFNNFSSTWDSAISSAKPSQTTTGLVWPNVPTRAPASMFGEPGNENYLLIGDGFLVPGKQTGNVIAVSTESLYKWTYLAPQDSDYFYHKAVPFDVDGDGDLDIVTCRATLPFLQKGSGQLLWLENKNTGLNDTWPAHVLQNGPDIIFDIHPWSTPGNLTIASGEFFNARVSLTVVQLGKVVRYAIVDDTIGAIDMVAFHQLDGTGRPNLLVTNHVDIEALSGVFAYTSADVSNPGAGNWTRTTLTQGFHTRAWFQGMSPGFAYPFYPNAANPSGFPTIAIAGDGAYELYLLLPTTKALQYTRVTLLAANGTVAALSVGDFNNDGWTDMLVPNYDLSTMYAYTFKPSS